VGRPTIFYEQGPHICKSGSVFHDSLLATTNVLGYVVVKLYLLFQLQNIKYVLF